MTTRSQSITLAMQKARSMRRFYPFVAPPELERETVRHVPVVIVGAGPVGLAMARELANHAIPVVVLEKHQTSSEGSRAICWSKRTLEICDRLGVAAPMCARGVIWNVAKIFSGERAEPLYSFDLLPIEDQKFPAFINLQQYYTEECLVDALEDSEVELRWQHGVCAVEQTPSAVLITAQTPVGTYRLSADYVIAADGCRSTVRSLLGLDFKGRTFEDNFLIADIRMQAPFPAERRFYFNAPFNEGRTALMHQQPDNVWRLDFQLGWDIDRAAALREENVSAKVRAMLGPDIDFEYEWVSLYTFQCRRMRSFVHQRVIFAGDAAHVLSPFGARGANGGIQDVDNLGWKLAHVLRGTASHRLLESYDEERLAGADENIRNSTYATDFMTPKTPMACAFHDAVLELAADFPFARALVNSGRLSVPCSLACSSLVTPDTEAFDTPDLAPGTVALDAPIARNEKAGWLMDLFGGDFVCLVFGAPPTAPVLPPGVRLLVAGIDFADPTGLVAARYTGDPQTTYLLRPDQHVAARWRHFDPARIMSAWQRSLGNINQT